MHSLTIKGGRSSYGISASCACGGWSDFLNTTTRRGGITSKKQFLKEQFKAHVAEAGAR